LVLRAALLFLLRSILVLATDFFRLYCGEAMGGLSLGQGVRSLYIESVSVTDCVGIVGSAECEEDNK